MKLWPSISPHLHTSTTTTSTNRRTLFTLVTASTVLLLSSQPRLAHASAPPSVAAAHQRTFRLGRPAAGLNTDAPRFFSSMSSVDLPAQNEAFDGFAQLPLEQPSESTARLIRDAMDLFGAKPSAELFRRSWTPTAIFADPICHAEGSRQYLAQWYGMPAAFAKSETLEWKLVAQRDSEIQYVQKQRYTVKGLGTTKDMVSTVVMQRDAATGKITRFEDRWNHKPLGGYLSWPFRRLNAYTLPFLVGVPKDAKQALDSNPKHR